MEMELVNHNANSHGGREATRKAQRPPSAAPCANRRGSRKRLDASDKQFFTHIQTKTQTSGQQEMARQTAQSAQSLSNYGHSALRQTNSMNTNTNTQGHAGQTVAV